MVKTINENQQTGEYLVNEEDGYRSRETITFLNVASTVIRPGTALGKVTASSKYVAHDPVAVDGSQNFAGIAYATYDVSDADVDGVMHAKSCTVNEEELIFVTHDAAQKTAAIAAMEALGIKVLKGTQK